MSDAHDEHVSPIKTPKQLIVAIVASFVVPIVIIILLVSYVTSDKKTGAGSNGMAPEAIAERIAPIAKLELVDASAPHVLKGGEDVYKAVCSACHASGAAGAPKFGDAAAWGDRIKQGVDVLYTHAIKGFQGKAGMMPVKGGNPDLDDVEVQRAVVFMANAGGAKFAEPAAPAAPAAAAPAAAPAADATPAAAAAPSAAAAAVAAANAAAPAPAKAAGDAGKKLYDAVCTACHTAGVAGAPKFGDKALWAPRIKQGLDVLYDHALKGFQGKAGMMPPKGGSSASDDDVKAAVRYMVDAAK